ncbi:MAG: B12-binding domain-containing radical SAM protein [Candidatus Hydrothermota bacterium]|nr:MAG: B12-binding domain-containing radical SAM protein [Candidatus Hydrothermae bacterium]
MSNFDWNDHPFGRALLTLERPGRYIGGEWNEIHKENPSSLLRIALVYPELYELGMSNLGLAIIYHVLNSHPKVYAERAYLLWLDAIEFMRRNRIPLFSLETKTPLREFDLIGISMHTELNYTNLLLTLDLANVPLKSDERSKGDPLVMLGGPCALNPEPLKRFVDFFVLGEAEQAVLEIVDPLLAWKNREITRDEVLAELAKIEGVFVPRYPKDRVRRRIAPLERKFFPIKQLVPNVEAVHNRFVIEIMRGCTRGCRFCEGGMVYRPIRIRDVDEVVEIAVEGVKATGFREIGLLAFTVSDYPDLEALIVKLKNALPHIDLSLPSLPINAISKELLDILADLSKFGITLAPETASERLRGVINKNVPLDEIFTSIRIAEERNWPSVKLYFMVGLPTETEDDVNETVKLLETIARTARRIRVRASFGTFVPRPHTPFQWVEQRMPDEMESVIHMIRRKLRRYRRLRISAHDPYQSALEGVFARGDERLADVLLEAYRLGAQFDDRRETFDFSIWEQAFENIGIDWREYLRPRELDEKLPWHYVDTGLFNAFLRLEYKRSLRGEYTMDCMRSRCNGCGPWYREGYELCRTGYVQKQKLESIEIAKLEAKPTKRVQYLVVYSKMPPASALGHNDTVRLIIQGFARAGWEFSYTEGFVKRPRISAGPSLALGATSEVELLVVESVKEYEPEKILPKLQSEMPDGIRLISIERLSRPLNWSEIKGSIYLFTLSDGRKVRVEVRHGGKKLRDYIEELKPIAVHRIGYL